MLITPIDPILASTYYTYQLSLSLSLSKKEMKASPVTNVKISSVVPALVTGENKPRKLTPMDLAMKLHCVRAVYFFKGTREFTTADLKNNMFGLLQLQCFYHITGRIRMSDNGPSSAGIPYLRCNDSGIRFVQANVEEFTVEEWLDLDDRSIDHRFLVYNQVLGDPDLIFSPLVFLQVLWISHFFESHDHRGHVTWVINKLFLWSQTKNQPNKILTFLYFSIFSNSSHCTVN